MSLSITTSLIGLLQWVAPLLCCAWALWRHKSRAQVVIVTAVGSFLASLLSVIPLVQMAVRAGEGLDHVPYVLFNLVISGTIFGAAIGLTVVVVRGIAASLSTPARNARRNGRIKE